MQNAHAATENIIYQDSGAMCFSVNGQALEILSPSK